ncbi:MurR/RpiR family transcriptional regulator [Lichenifustis flavocetrariae]|uniref:MurR/RpiR family transcriptional regulator n=1 Tax=Lichenifustis flavocetrariae TaxID=2949735 RepID=A0AA41Z0L4_9HYPH|nr:MurR/RpiR family transcriptional regulator [Lichenifustis flavocetrariae]MCW6510588.1 MurR/RpiR family transcriptional regulator [Lichenifustis flavocetrariae]
MVKLDKQDLPAVTTVAGGGSHPLPQVASIGTADEETAPQRLTRLHEPPRDFDALKSLLQVQGSALPKRLRQVAVFALDRPDEFAFGTAAHLAEVAQVQASTLVRFAQTLGYAGFSDLQTVFRDHLKKSFPDYRDRLTKLSDRNGAAPGPASLFDGFVHAATISLERAQQALDVGKLEQAVATLAKADCLYIMGARRMFPVAAYFAYACGNLGLKAFLIDQVGGLGPEQASHASPVDAILAISFTPYAPASIEAARLAVARGVPLVALTDSAFSPLCPLADVYLEVAEADFGAFRSLAATFALAMTLAVATAEARQAAEP